MLKKPITYTTLDGDIVTEEFYFNLTKAELIKMEASKSGGLQQTLSNLSAERDGAKIIQIFDEILATAYGRRSEDGKNFIKKPEFFDEFKSSEAYSILFMELVEGGENAAKFIQEIMPKELVAEVEKRQLQDAYLERVRPVQEVRNEFEAQGIGAPDPDTESPQPRVDENGEQEPEFGYYKNLGWTRPLDHQEVMRLNPEQYRSYTDWLIKQ